VDNPAPPGTLPGAALDGKLLKGARTGGGRVFLVAALTHDNAVVLGQRQVADERGEGSAAHDLLSGLDVAGMVLTLDSTPPRRPPA
jgi:hypothetical protein